MFVTRESDYAVRCVLHLSADPDRTASAGEIAKATGVSRSFLSKILQKLAAAEIVESARGVKGGFRLTREPAGIDLLGVIVAIQGVSAMNQCAVDKKFCRRTGTCAAHPVWVRLRMEVEEKLKKISFAELARGTAPARTGSDIN